jgi:tRNA splicing ligase
MNKANPLRYFIFHIVHHFTKKVNNILNNKSNVNTCAVNYREQKVVWFQVIVCLVVRNSEINEDYASYWLNVHGIVRKTMDKNR